MDASQMFEMKLTILKMAGDMLHNEYVDKKSQNHNQWLIHNEVMWRTQGVKIPYPAFPPYPSQEEVLKKAEVLWQCFFTSEKFYPLQGQEPTSPPPENKNSTDPELETVNNSLTVPVQEPDLGDVSSHQEEMANNIAQETVILEAPDPETPILETPAAMELDPEPETPTIVIPIDASLLNENTSVADTTVNEETNNPQPISQSSRFGNLSNWLLKKSS